MKNQKYGTAGEGSRANQNRENNSEDTASDRHNNPSNSNRKDGSFKPDPSKSTNNPNVNHNPNDRSNNDPDSNQRDRTKTENESDYPTSRLEDDWEDKNPPTGRNDNRQNKDDESDENIDQDEDGSMHRDQKREHEYPGAGRTAL